MAPTLAQTILDANSNAYVTTIAHTPSSAMALAGKGGECYWIDDLGNWATAACYTKTLPEWVNTHNEAGFNRAYVQNTWFGKLTKGKYINIRTTDIRIYDLYAKQKGFGSKKLSDAWVEDMLHSPAGNSAILEFASKVLDHMVADKQKDGIKCSTSALMYLAM